MATNNPARLRQIRDAVIAEMNADVGAKDEANQALPIPQFVATAKWNANPSHQQANDLLVYVRAMTRAIEPESRGGNELNYGIEIAFQKTILPREDFDTRFDELTDIVNRVARYFQPNSELYTTGFENVVITECLMTIYDPALLDAGRFFATVNLVLREWSDRGI